MIGKLLGKEETNAAVVLALTGALMVLVAQGDRPLSLRRVMAKILSNPVPKVAAGTRDDTSVPHTNRQIAA